MTSAARAGRVGGRLAVRLSLQLALAAALVAGIAGGAAREFVRVAFERRAADEVATQAGRAAAAWDRSGNEAGQALERTERTLRRFEPGLLEALLAQGRGARDVASRLMDLESLDVLDVLDPQGVVLSSGHWPEQAGLPAGPEITLPLDTSAVRRVDGPSGPIPVLLGRRDVTVGSRVLALVGGLRLDDETMEGIAHGQAVALLDGQGRVVAASPAGKSLTDKAGTADPVRWSLARVPLQGGMTLLVGVDRSGMDAAIRSVGRRMLLVMVAAVFAAALAGVWVARRAARPVAELVRAVDAIAAGREDYTFTRQTEDEFEQLVTAFSRLHRSLEWQREHARAAERVAAWRDVARQVAHEVKNPLAPIRLTVENLVRARRRRHVEFDTLFDQGAATILEEVERLRLLVGEFSEFARLPLPRREPVDPARLVRETLALWAGEPGLDVTLRIEDPVPVLSLDVDQIARALKNVVANGVESMRDLPGPRTLDVTVETAGGWVTVSVADRGAGFDEQTARRLFEPYFTTKPGGTGLGLAITYRIVVEHGGVIHAENRDGGGGRIVIRLPPGEPSASGERPW